MRDHANFQNEQTQVRDGVPFFIFVRHESFDQHGNRLPDDGSTFPGACEKKRKGAAQNSSAFDLRGDVQDDPGLASSSSEEEEVDYDNDAEDPLAKEHTHKFTVNFVVRFPDENEELALHWGMSRKQEGVWGTPDQSFHPRQTQSWGDGLAC